MDGDGEGCERYVELCCLRFWNGLVPLWWWRLRVEDDRTGHGRWGFAHMGNDHEFEADDQCLQEFSRRLALMF